MPRASESRGTRCHFRAVHVVELKTDAACECDRLIRMIT